VEKVIDYGFELLYQGSLLERDRRGYTMLGERQGLPLSSVFSALVYSVILSTLWVVGPSYKERD
jgi:hypothetical protein